MTGAKELRQIVMVISVISVSILLTACSSSDLRRFAPPGIIRYEDLAKGEPIDPVVQSRIDESNAEKGKSFPVISEQQTTIPEGLDAPSRDELTTNLEQSRATAAADIAKAREDAQLERQQSIIAKREQAEAAIEQGANAIARENRGPLPEPPSPNLD